MSSSSSPTNSTYGYDLDESDSSPVFSPSYSSESPPMSESSSDTPESRSRSRSRSMSGSRSGMADDDDEDNFLQGISRLMSSHDEDEDDSDDEGSPKKDEPNVGYREHIEFANVEEVICMFCFGVPKDPIKLACGHTMCRACAVEAAELFKATSLFTKRYDLRDCELLKEDCCLTCPVCMQTVVVKGGVESAEVDEHMKKLCEINKARHGKALCGMCVSEACSGCNVNVEEGVMECDICGPLCEKHGCLHGLKTGHSKNSYITYDDNHMNIAVTPRAHERVFLYDKKFDLSKGVEDKIILDSDWTLCEVYCQDCKKPISRLKFFSLCAQKDHKVISLEEAAKSLREDEETESKDEKIKGISAKCDKIDDDLAEVSMKLAVAKSLLEDDICIDNMDQARDLVKSSYSRIRAACDAAEADALQRLEKKALEVKERMKSICDATSLVIENAQRLSADAISALTTVDSGKVNLDAIDGTLSGCFTQVRDVSGIRQTPYNMFSLVKETRSFTDDEIKKLLPCGLTFEDEKETKPQTDSDISDSDSDSGDNNGKESEEKGGSDNPSIEEARKRIKDAVDSDEDKRINSRYSSLRSIIGTSIEDMDAEQAQQLVCAAIYEIISNIRPHFDDTSVFLLTEAFASIHDMDEVDDKFSRVSDLFHELQAIALTLGLSL